MKKDQKTTKETETENPCFQCKAKCCGHVALPIDKPTTERDFDDLRWYMAHKNVSVFVEDNDWYVCFTAPCRYLKKDYRCGIYDTRPAICRKYKTETCEGTNADDPYDLYLATVEDVEAYAKDYLDKRKARQKKGTLKS
jgi:Fe-S-cluster containining protein